MSEPSASQNGSGLSPLQQALVGLRELRARLEAVEKRLKAALEATAPAKA